MASRPPPSICVVLITKNEHDMIGDCLEYYSRLTGDARHVYVVDNGSTHPDVLSTYDHHRSRGGVVKVDARPFKRATQFMSEHIRACATRYDWILPMETDEIVCDLGPRDVRPEGPRDVRPEEVRRAVLAELAAQPSTVGVLRYGKVLGSLVDPGDAGYSDGAYARPIRQIRRFFDQGWDKLVIRSDAFVSMQLWCHHAVLKPGYEVAISGAIGILHFHETGIRRLIERSKPVVDSYGYFDCDDDLNVRETGPHPANVLRKAPIACGHKVAYLAGHYWRLATLRAFRRTLGRLPESVEEMDRYAKNFDRHPAVSLRHDLAHGVVRRTVQGNKRNLSFGDLLYFEPRQTNADEFEFRVVFDGAGADSGADAGAAPSVPFWVTGFVDR